MAFPKITKHYTAIGDRLYPEREELIPLCFDGENNKLEISVTLDDKWVSVGCLLEIESSAGEKDYGGTLNNGVLTYSVPHALMKAGILTFHLKGVSDDVIIKSDNAEIPVRTSFDAEKNGEEFEPTVIDNIYESLSLLSERLGNAEGNITTLSDDLADAERSIKNEIAERDEIFSAVMNKIPVTNLEEAFRNSKISKFPSLNLSSVTNFQKAFYSNEYITEVGDLDLSSCTSLNYAFQNCTNLKKVGKLSGENISKFYSLFRGCSLLETVEEINMTNANSCNQMFHICYGLRNIRFAGTIPITLDLRYSYNLTPESLQSIINALSEDGQGNILYLHNTCKELLTDEQKQTVTDKGWTLG